MAVTILHLLGGSLGLVYVLTSLDPWILSFSVLGLLEGEVATLQDLQDKQIIKNSKSLFLVTMMPQFQNYPVDKKSPIRVEETVPNLLKREPAGLQIRMDCYDTK